MLKRLIIFVIPFILILAGCQNGQLDLSKVSEKDVDKLIKCEQPYMRHASGCCLDQNDNNICDSDDRELE